MWCTARFGITECPHDFRPYCFLIFSGLSVIPQVVSFSAVLESERVVFKTSAKTMWNEKDHIVLCIPQNAAPELINGAFKKQCLIWHPDKPDGDKEHFQRISAARNAMLAAKKWLEVADMAEYVAAKDEGDKGEYKPVIVQKGADYVGFAGIFKPSTLLKIDITSIEQNVEESSLFVWTAVDGALSPLFVGGLLPCTTYRIMFSGDGVRDQLTFTTDPLTVEPKKGRKNKKTAERRAVHRPIEKNVKLGVSANFMVRVEKVDDSLHVHATPGVNIVVEKKTHGEWHVVNHFTSQGFDTIPLDLTAGANVFRCVATASSFRFRF